MIEVLEFIFRDFWTWLGSFLMLGIIASMPCSLIKIVNQKNNSKDSDKAVTKCKDCKHFSQKPDYCHKLCVDVDKDFWCKYAEDSN